MAPEMLSSSRLVRGGMATGCHSKLSYNFALEVSEHGAGIDRGNQKDTNNCVVSVCLDPPTCNPNMWSPKGRLAGTASQRTFGRWAASSTSAVPSPWILVDVDRERMADARRV